MTDGPYENHPARFMRAKGLTDPGLAKLLDPESSKQQIYNLRKGHRKLTVEWAKRLAPALDVPWQELITGGTPQTIDPRIAGICAAYAEMSERARETLFQVAEGLRPEPSRRVIPHQERPPPPRPRSGGSVIENSNAGDCAKVVRWPGATA